MQIICTSLQTDNHASTSPNSFCSLDAFPLPNQQCQSTVFVFFYLFDIYIIKAVHHIWYWHSRSSIKNVSSIRSPVVDEVRPLVRVSALCYLCALTLVVGWQEGHPAHKTPHSTNPRGSIAEQGRRTQGGTSWPGFTWKNGCYTEVVVTWQFTIAWSNISSVFTVFRKQRRSGCVQSDTTEMFTG